MTLSPVFRSEQAVRILQDEGIWERLTPVVARQIEAVRIVQEDLAQVISEVYRLGPEAMDPLHGREGNPLLGFTQDYFFLILFLAVLESLDPPPQQLPFYAQLDFCIMGTITAADNLFDDQDKNLLPLRTGYGARYGSILQLMCFERLIRRVGDRAVAEEVITSGQLEAVLKALIDQMAEIGRLEGSEEGGVEPILTPSAMIDQVHRVRGGMLFQLAFAAPHIIVKGEAAQKLGRAEEAIARLGTAFQIVDDLTDFEFDLDRRSHNLLVSQIHHHGTKEEQEKLKELRSGGGAPLATGLVEGLFAESARSVLEQARVEARESFAQLEGLGFWFPPRLADEVVHAIVGLDGVARMAGLIAPDGV